MCGPCAGDGSLQQMQDHLRGPDDRLPEQRTSPDSPPAPGIQGGWSLVATTQTPLIPLTTFPSLQPGFQARA